MRRLPATLADYLLVGITPGLIMLLIGSLMFFLVAVFYRGDYEFRMYLIISMFIMGTVALARIAMEEGFGYAGAFAFPLGIVSFFGLGGTPLSIVMIVVVWFLAYQLTYDCTIIDERADTSDQGLLEAVGVGEQRPPEDANLTEDPVDPLLAGEEPHEEQPAWLAWFERSKKPHAHGVWVIYFSLAALPMFGLGQWFLPQPSRTWALMLLVVYCAAALGLLMSTSFLGLRRYLRKRRLEMPLEMTATWLGVGTVLIAGVLLVCLFLPRPGGEVAASQWLTITSRDLEPSRWGWGNDGKKERPGGARAQGEGEQEGAGAGEQGSKGAGEQAGGGAGEQGSGGAEEQGSKGAGEQGQGDGKGKQSEQPQQKSNDQAGDKGAQGESGNSGQTQNPQQPQESAAANSANQDSSSKQGNSANQEKSAGQESSANRENAGKQPDSPKPESSANQSASKSDATGSQAAAEQQPAPSTPPKKSFSLSSLFSSLGTVLKLALYAAILGVVAFLAWKYRSQLAAAWRQLLKELAELWERLFGRSATAASAQEATAAPPARRFASYQDPFATGQAGRITRTELLRYSFEALTVWGREHGCEWEESETPHEYVQRLSMSAPNLAREAAALAECYGLAAYANAMLPASFAEPLRSLWLKMKEPATVASTR